MSCYIENFVMISSLIKTTNNALSYSVTRSVYTHEERFTQTLRTISSVRKYIPNSRICLIDCSPFTEDENNQLKIACDYFINLYDDEKTHHIMRYGNSKSLAEATQTHAVIQFIRNNHIQMKNFIKITGRYELNSEFNYALYDNEKNVGRIHPDVANYMLTSFYKLRPDALEWLNEMILNETNLYALRRAIPYEEFFLIFMKSLDNVQILECPIGIDEYISVTGDYNTR